MVRLSRSIPAAAAAEGAEAVGSQDVEAGALVADVSVDRVVGAPDAADAPAEDVVGAAVSAQETAAGAVGQDEGNVEDVHSRETLDGRGAVMATGDAVMGARRAVPVEPVEHVVAPAVGLQQQLVERLAAVVAVAPFAFVVELAVGPPAEKTWQLAVAVPPSFAVVAGVMAEVVPGPDCR